MSDIWRSLMNMLPDLKSGTFEVRDLLNLFMTALGAYLAWQAIKMGREQSVIARRQGEIAEAQHAIMQQQLTKVPKLKFESHGQFKDEGLVELTVIIKNRGRGIAEDCYWEILLPYNTSEHPFLAPLSSLHNHLVGYKNHVYRAYGKHYQAKIFPDTEMQILTVVVGLAQLREGFKILWRIECEDKRFPEEGYSLMGFQVVIVGTDDMLAIEND
jgi:hypothetical protein